MKPSKIPFVFNFMLLLLLFYQSLFSGVKCFEAARPGWHLAAQAWTFRKLTLYETIDKLKELDIHWLEAYARQELSPDHPEVIFGPDMPDSLREEVKNKLKENQITLVNFGVVRFDKDWETNEKVFQFAKDMGIQTIVGEPAKKDLKKVDKLCQKYQIQVAIHNHPKPTTYWNPKVLMKALKGRSRWMGVDADIGHWMRAGIEIEQGLDLTKNRLISLHFKDLNTFGIKKAHDVPWGQGQGNARRVLTQLDNIGFMGVISIEYEHITDHLTSDVRQCIEFYRANASALAPKWETLFNQDLSNARFPEGAWEWADSVLIRKGGGNIRTTKAYDNFILEMDFKMADSTNSGVLLRCEDPGNYVQTSIEVQIHALDQKPKHKCGAVFDCQAPSADAAKSAGEWNHYRISCLGNRIHVALNHQSVIQMNLLAWNKANRNPDGTPNKYNKPLLKFPKKGYIGLQDHGQPVWFRNIRIRPVH